MNELYTDIRTEDLKETNQAGYPNIWREVADNFGVEVVVFISEKYGGTKIDVPSFKRLIGPALDRHCGITER